MIIMQTRWLSRITWLYLTLPFIIFCMGWLRLSIAIPITAIILWAFWQLLTQSPNLHLAQVQVFQLPIT